MCYLLLTTETLGVHGLCFGPGVEQQLHVNTSSFEMTALNQNLSAVKAPSLGRGRLPATDPSCSIVCETEKPQSTSRPLQRLSVGLLNDTHTHTLAITDVCTCDWSRSLNVHECLCE